MRTLMVLTLALIAGQACADNCTDLAKRFAADKASLKVGELDELVSCISDVERDKAQGPDVIPAVSAVRTPVSAPVDSTP